MNAVLRKRIKTVLLVALLLCTIALTACNGDMSHQTSGVKEEVPDRHQESRPEDAQVRTGSPFAWPEVIGENKGPVSVRVTKGPALGRKLVEDGSTNILLLGEDRASYLYDTICIMSVSKREKTVTIIMVPRDAYIEYEDTVLEVLDKEEKRNVAGVYKINYTHHIGAMMHYQGKFDSSAISFLAQVLEEKLGIAVDDYVKVDLDGLMSLVDLFGGVEVNVPYDMNYEDPYQSLSIHIAKGKQTLDGKTAEGFVRFRQGYTADGRAFEIGDPGRKKNQIAFLQAFIKQHGTLRNIDKVPGVLDKLNKHVRHSVGLGDILTTYMGLARDTVAENYELQSVNLDGKQKKIDGAYYILIE